MGSGCMPPPFTLSSDSVRAGGSLTVGAKDATCNPRYGADARIQLEITDGSGEKVVKLLAPMNDAGGFGAVLTVPEGAAPGRGAVAAQPYNVDWCDDTGRNNRLGGNGTAGPDAGEIQRVSCVLPSQPLTIEP